MKQYPSSKAPLTSVDLGALEKHAVSDFLASPAQASHFADDNFVYVTPGMNCKNLRILHHGFRKNISSCTIIVLSAEGRVSLAIGDSDAYVYIGEKTRCSGMDLRLWRSGRFIVRHGSTINSMRAVVDNADVIIGPDCMLSDEILLQSNDQHAIVDLHEKKLLNGGRRHISIGEHSWIGRRSIIMPDVAIGSGAIVATGAIVTQDVPPFSIAAGVPARVVRENVSWARGTRTLSSLEQNFFTAAGHELPDLLEE